MMTSFQKFYPLQKIYWSIHSVKSIYQCINTFAVSIHILKYYALMHHSIITSLTHTMCTHTHTHKHTLTCTYTYTYTHTNAYTHSLAGEKFSEFDKSSVICQTKTIQIWLIIITLMAESIHLPNFSPPNTQW